MLNTNTIDQPIYKTVVETSGGDGIYIYQGNREIAVGDEVEIGDRYTTVTKIYTADLFDLPYDIDYAW